MDWFSVLHSYDRDFCGAQRFVIQTDLVQQAIKGTCTRPGWLVAQGNTRIAVGDATRFGCAGRLHAVFVDRHIAAIIHGRYMIPLSRRNRAIAGDECAGGAVGFETETQLADHYSSLKPLYLCSDFGGQYRYNAEQGFSNHDYLLLYLNTSLGSPYPIIIHSPFSFCTTSILSISR